MRFALTLGLSGLSFIAPQVIAQTRSASALGTGSLSLPNTAAVPLAAVNINQRDATFTLSFKGTNAALSFLLGGRATGNASGSEIPIEITGGLSDRQTRGSGRIVLSGARVVSVELRGTGRQGPFSLQFRGDGVGGGGVAPGPDLGSGIIGARPINESATGSGTYEFSGRRARLTEMRIRLHDDGRAELNFDGDQSVGGRGTWRRGVGGRADLALSEWGGRRTNGTAAVTFRGRQIERIGVNIPSQNGRVEFFPGRSDTGDNWGGGGGNSGAQPIDMSTTGSGTYELAGRRSNLNEMRIRLRGDGRAELRFDGDRSAEGEGTWRRGYNGRAEIDIIQWNGRRTSGTAAVTYRGREIDRVDLNVPSQRARIDFQPTGNAGGGGPGGNTAQPVNTSFVGSGEFRDRGRVYQLEEASVRLRDDGDAELRFEGQRRTGGRGTWRRFGAYATLTIVEWDGQRTNGTGNVAFTRSQPSQVTVTLPGGRSITFRSRPQIQPR